MPKAIFNRLSAVMSEMRKLQEGSGVMSIQTFEVFLTVAAKEGISSSDIRKNTGIAQPTVSRALGDLGDWAAKKNSEGLKLVRSERDPNDLRNVLVYLTPTGKLLAARIEQLMGVGNVTVDDTP